MADKTQPIGFSFINIVTEQFAILEEAYEAGKETDIQMETRFGFLAEDRRIASGVRFSFRQKEVPYLILEISCVFQVEDASWLRLYGQEQVTLPRGFVAHLLSLTISTARGVLHAKTEQTPMSEIMIPLINVNEAVKEDLVI